MTDIFAPTAVSRRRLLRSAGLTAAITPIGLAAPVVFAANQAKILRVGTQKGAAILMVERQERGLEALLNPLGIEVQWVEFAFGPPMMEAMRVGSVDIGLVGDTPPIFAQAAKSDLLYIAAVPSGASAILLPAGSSVKTLQDLKGKKIAVAKASSSHNLIIAALEKAELNFSDVQVIFLTPADAAAAFERGAVDAWTIWDPFYALYEARPGVRVLAESTTITEQNSFFIGSRAFVEANSDLTAKVIGELGRTSDWAAQNRMEVAKLVSDGTGMALEPTERATRRYPFKVVPMNDAYARAQQDIADRFHRLGVIPAKIKVADQVWRHGA